ncbi:hypothetical protein Tco_0778600 [Tanacetum coccineum]
MYNRYNTERRMVNKFKEDDLCMNRHEYDILALDTAMREQKSDHSEMRQLVENDPYAIIRDAATAAARNDDGDDTPASKDPQPSETHGSPSDS